MQQTFLGVDDGTIHTRYQTLVFRRLRPVGRRVLQPDLRTIQEQVEFLGRIVLDFLVEVEESAMGIANPAPATLAERDVVDGVLVVQALVEVHELVNIQLANLAQPRAARTATLGMIERERFRIAHEGLSHTREQQAHQGSNVGIGAHGGTRVLRGFLLVDNDGDGQVLDAFHMRSPILRQILLHERRERVVQLASRLCRYRVEH